MKRMGHMIDNQSFCHIMMMMWNLIMIVVIVAIVVKQKFDDMEVVVDDVHYDNDEDLNLVMNMLMVWD